MRTRTLVQGQCECGTTGWKKSNSSFRCERCRELESETHNGVKKLNGTKSVKHKQVVVKALDDVDVGRNFYYEGVRLTTTDIMELRVAIQRFWIRRGLPEPQTQDFFYGNTARPDQH